jgi:hypothetical protein
MKVRMCQKEKKEKEKKKKKKKNRVRQRENLEFFFFFIQHTFEIALFLIPNFSTLTNLQEPSGK